MRDGEMICFFAEMIDHGSTKPMFRVGTKDERQVFECSTCGLVHCPQPSEEEYLKLYTDGERYYNMSVGVGYDNFGLRFDHDYKIAEVRAKNLRNRLRNDEEEILDVGCGNGALVRRLSKLGILHAYGIDIDPWTVEHAKQHSPLLHIRCRNFLDGDLHGETFDAVLFTDSFEHFLRPLTAVRTILGLLRKDGLVVVEMPDTGSAGWWEERLDWCHMKPLEHPFLYNSNHVAALFKHIGMKIVDTIYTIPGRATYYIR